MAPDVDVIIPMKPPGVAKSRLRGALGDTPDPHTHASLVRALAFDTLAAAISATGVRDVFVITADPDALEALRTMPVRVVAERGIVGLNAAIRHGEAHARQENSATAIAALHADLPALRHEELTDALAEARGERAFAADRHGRGTTLLISAPGMPLLPQFGVESARAHAESSAKALRLPAPSLRTDVDTHADLTHATKLGLGRHTAALLEQCRTARCVP